MTPVSHPLYSSMAQDTSKKLLHFIFLTKWSLLLGVCPGGLHLKPLYWVFLKPWLPVTMRGCVLVFYLTLTLSLQLNGPCVSVSRDRTDGIPGLRCREQEFQKD